VYLSIAYCDGVATAICVGPENTILAYCDGEASCSISDFDPINRLRCDGVGSGTITVPEYCRCDGDGTWELTPNLGIADACLTADGESNPEGLAVKNYVY
jgi:hypothetical protein